MLLCEDDPRVGMCVASVLHEVGIEVTGPIGTAQEALAECFRQPPDLALIDIGLIPTAADHFHYPGWNAVENRPLIGTDHPPLV